MKKYLCENPAHGEYFFESENGYCDKCHSNDFTTEYNEKYEELAYKIIDFFKERDMWFDSAIYFNGHCIKSNSDKKYIDRPNFEFYDRSDPTAISMRFEGPIYELLNFYWEDSEASNQIIEDFNALLKEYGLYYELGNAWNLALYKI